MTKKTDVTLGWGEVIRLLVECQFSDLGLFLCKKKCLFQTNAREYARAFMRTYDSAFPHFSVRKKYY